MAASFALQLAVAAALGAGLGLPSAVAAAPITLDFDALPRGEQFQPGEVFFEDGFSITAVLGDGFGARGSVFSFATDPRQFLFAGLDFFAEGDVLEIARVGGGRFTVEEFQNGSVNLGGNDLVDLIGLRNGTEVGAIRGLTDMTGGFQQPSNTPITQSGLVFGEIDTLRFVIGTQNISGNGIAFDNFVLNTVTSQVPVPAGLPLLVAGLGVLTIVRRGRARIAGSG